jgi:hypothetical protein
MDFKLGVIIVGSLLWDEKPIRQKWRLACIKDINSRISVPIKIRYGRQSESREHTYTIILSNQADTQLGQGLIFESADLIKSFKNLEKQVFALARAEGIWKEDDKEPKISKNWGTVGLLLNPSIDKKNKVNADFIRTRWTELHKQHSSGFKFSDYQIENEESVIDEDGFLNISWTKEMDDFDLLIATPTVPKPKRSLTAREVAGAIRNKKYSDYFDKNRNNQITTFQDEEITSLLRAE